MSFRLGLNPLAYKHDWYSAPAVVHNGALSVREVCCTVSWALEMTENIREIKYLSIVCLQLLHKTVLNLLIISLKGHSFIHVKC
jgi:hypothetical protein